MQMYMYKVQIISTKYTGFSTYFRTQHTATFYDYHYHFIIGELEKQSWYLLRISTPEQTPFCWNLYKSTALLNCTASNF